MDILWKKFFLSNLQVLETIFPSHIYKLNKALHELKQATRAWYESSHVFW